MSNRSDIMIYQHYPLAGLGVLLLTAADWLVSTRDVGSVRLDRDVTLWEMLGVVNERFLFGAIVGIAVIVGFAVACLTWAAHRSRITVSCLGWLAVIANVLIIMSIDGGFSAGTGAWLSLAPCASAALAPMIRLIVLGGRAAVPGRRP